MPKLETTFSQQLAFLNRGIHDRDLTDALAEMATAVEERGGKAVLTLKLTLKQFKKSGRVQLDIDISTKLPKEDRDSEVLFVGPGGQLLRKDPNQEELTLTRVDTETGELVRIPDNEEKLN